jgi:hypothetical protein
MSTMFVRRILVVTTACALAWVYSTTGRDGHAEAPGVAPAAAVALPPPPATAAMPLRGTHEFDPGAAELARRGRSIVASKELSSGRQQPAAFAAVQQQ